MTPLICLPCMRKILILTKSDKITAIRLDLLRTMNPQHITCRIPVETLSVIFSFLIQTLKIGEEEKPPWMLMRKKRRWYSFSQVCRHWRQIALDDPRLWSTIDFDHTSALCMLERSKDAPLHLSVRLGTG
jgi:hypothetical protein